jgi:hypothetical protein
VFFIKTKCDKSRNLRSLLKMTLHGSHRDRLARKTGGVRPDLALLHDVRRRSAALTTYTLADCCAGTAGRLDCDDDDKALLNTQFDL